MASVKRPTISSKFSFSNLLKKKSSSSSNKVVLDQAISPKSRVAILPIYKSVDTFIESDAEEEDELVDSPIAIVGRTVRLNSQSPLSEIPKTWMEWDKAYAAVSLY